PSDESEGGDDSIHEMEPMPDPNAKKKAFWIRLLNRADYLMRRNPAERQPVDQVALAELSRHCEMYCTTILEFADIHVQDLGDKSVDAWQNLIALQALDLLPLPDGDGEVNWCNTMLALDALRSAVRSEVNLGFMFNATPDDYGGAVPSPRSNLGGEPPSRDSARPPASARGPSAPPPNG
ncbi:MAG: hypothetical protein ACREHG_03070, partial [Candidatus Saccharimonadales bacterium]